MSKSEIQFIWGPGGVGKSHYAIRQAALSQGSCLLISLDPSPRIFELLHKERSAETQTARLGNYEFDLRATDADRLFEDLEKKSPASEQVRIYYRELTKGLQRFRDYLALIQLADELSTSNYDLIIVDTPPFQEAVGLHQSVLSLREFFDRTLVHFAMKSKWLALGLKKVIEVAQIFVGKRGVEQALEFVDWLNKHISRFQNSSRNLEQLIFSDRTKHSMILTPETSHHYIDMLEDFFGKMSSLSFVLNRSALDFQIPKDEIPFFNEMRALQKAETALLSRLQKSFSDYQTERIPLEVMGDDSEEELIKFVHLGGDPKISPSNVH